MGSTSVTSMTKDSLMQALAMQNKSEKSVFKPLSKQEFLSDLRSLSPATTKSEPTGPSAIKLPEEAPDKVVQCPIVKTQAQANWYLNRGGGVGIDIT